MSNQYRYFVGIDWATESHELFVLDAEQLFHRVRIDKPLVIRIRELSRNEEDVPQEQVRTGHQLRDLLRLCFPQMVELCPGIDEPWLWELMELAPNTAKAAKLTRARVEKLLRSHRIRPLTAEEIVAQLKAPPLRLATGAVEAASEHVLLLIRVFECCINNETTLQAGSKVFSAN